MTSKIKLKKNVRIAPADLKNNYETLASAIVIQAVQDYIGSNKGTLADEVRRDEIREFFHSSFFEEITSIDPDTLIRYLDSGKSKLRLTEFYC